MKILGNTLFGDLIIQVSQSEWDSLQNGTRPRDDIEIQYEKWHGSEAGQFFNSQKNLRGRSAFYFMFRDGKFDGTLGRLREILDENYPVRNIGPSIREHLSQALRSYEQERLS